MQSLTLLLSCFMKRQRPNTTKKQSISDNTAAVQYNNNLIHSRWDGYNYRDAENESLENGDRCRMLIGKKEKKKRRESERERERDKAVACSRGGWPVSTWQRACPCFASKAASTRSRDRSGRRLVNFSSCWLAEYYLLFQNKKAK